MPKHLLTGSLLQVIHLPETNSKSIWKWMVGIRSFPFGARSIFRGELLVVYSTIFFVKHHVGRIRLFIGVRHFVAIFFDTCAILLIN